MERLWDLGKIPKGLFNRMEEEKCQLQLFLLSFLSFFLSAPVLALFFSLFRFVSHAFIKITHQLLSLSSDFFTRRIARSPPKDIRLLFSLKPSHWIVVFIRWHWITLPLSSPLVVGTYSRPETNSEAEERIIRSNFLVIVFNRLFRRTIVNKLIGIRTASNAHPFPFDYQCVWFESRRRRKKRKAVDLVLA